MVASRLPGHRAYQRTAEGPFANRPVNLRDLGSRLGGSERIEAMLGELLEPMGFHHQLRSVLYDQGGDFSVFVGLYRPISHACFDVGDHAELHALQPALQRWATLAEALGFEPLGDGELLRAVEAIKQPAVVTHQGLVVLANSAARAIDGGHEVLLGLAKMGQAIPLRTPRLSLELVLLPDRPSVKLQKAAALSLPPYLKPTLDLMRQGASDKTIAASLGVSHSTARTYVQRVMKAMGVESRRALVARR